MKDCELSVSAGQALRSALWHELWKAGLIPDAARYRATYAQVMRLGKAEYPDIRARVGALTWWRGLLAVGQPSPTAVQRILGWGRLLTEFFIAPVPLTGVQRIAIARLGALENLIVTLYDSLVDWQASQADSLPRAALELAVDGSGPFTEAKSNMRMPMSSGILMRLVAGYFSGLNRLSDDSSNGHVRCTVARSILMMYDAERELLSTKRPMGPIARKRMLLRTSACPFVVMGLPAWLSIRQFDQQLYAWHLRWLYRLGQFCAWVDHAVDWDTDVASSRFNLIADSLTGEEDGCAIADLAYQIAHDGALLLDEWDRHVGVDDQVDLSMRTTIQACVASWFGGVTCA